MSSDPCCQNSKLFSIEVSINGTHQCLCLFRGTMANDIGVTTSGFHVFRFDPPCGRCGHRMYVQTPDGIDDHDLLSFAVAQNHHCSLGRDQWCHYQHSNHTNDGTHQCLCLFCGTEHISCAGFLHVCGIPVADEPRRVALGPLPPSPPVGQ